jgi:uncharacterized protein YjbI with pentapeptide repeats
MVSRPLAPRPPRLPSALSTAETQRPDDQFEWLAVETAGEFSGQSARNGEINESLVRGARFVGTTLDRLRVRDSIFESCDLSGASLVDAAFTRVEFRNCKMSAVDLAGARLLDVLFHDSKLDDANCRMTSGDHVLFEQVSLGSSDFYAAELAHAQFLDCDLSSAQFSKAELAGVRLHGSNLEGLRGAIHLRNAIIDSTQVLPLALGVFAALDIRIDDDQEAD